jgi:hypothetical protein
MITGFSIVDQRDLKRRSLPLDPIPAREEKNLVILEKLVLS